MRNLVLTIAVVLLLFGCSSKEKNLGNSEITPSVQEEIQTTMEQEGFFNPEDIFHYENKGEYIFVLSHTLQKGIQVTTFKNSSEGLKMMDTTETSEATLVSPTKNDGPYLMAIQPEDPDVKDVKAFGKQTKLIKINKEYTEDFKDEIKCWIFIDNEIGKSPEEYNEIEDIEYIK
ncbi:hypothetical protein [Sporosarcina sp. P29]|uniref:hypothetical protein n=1 Tax=Sporosarcina sp. P29 TaxID=2048252 RepID=UPI000C16BDB8|nr:hypothetical protein [Sporosarcina sp. P29]PIC97813.1 hypothetical protein CSV68_16485 [Sporosarcina sp. P29]